MWTTALILIAAVAYATWRAVAMFRSGRPGFGIAVVFVIAVLLYELLLLLLRVLNASGQ